MRHRTAEESKRFTRKGLGREDYCRWEGVGEAAVVVMVGEKHESSRIEVGACVGACVVGGGRRHAQKSDPHQHLPVV